MVSNKQSAKVICRLNGVRIAHSKRQTSHMSIGMDLVSNVPSYVSAASVSNDAGDFHRKNYLFTRYPIMH